MPNTLQEFMGAAIPKAAADLEAALLRLPEDKRNWQTTETARSAMDQVAECAILNGIVAELLGSRKWPEDYDFGAFQRRKAELCQDWPGLKALLDENTARIAAAVRAVPEADLAVEVGMPWGPMSLAQIIAYPYWNLAYHEGQINYIASMLGCLLPPPS